MPPRDRTRRRRQPTQARAHDTVEAILVAAARVLEQEGYSRATTNRIADVAGVNIALLYRYFAGKPLWGFGYGLSYSTFKYGPVKLSAETLKAGDPVNATVTVTNTGKAAGDEVVEAYLKTPQEGGPISSLVGFERVTLEAGASKDVTIRIDPRSLSSVDDKGNRAILAGKYTLTLGGAQPQETEAKSEAGFTVTGTAAVPK